MEVLLLDLLTLVVLLLLLNIVTEITIVVVAAAVAVVVVENVVVVVIPLGVRRDPLVSLCWFEMLGLKLRQPTCNRPLVGLVLSEMFTCLVIIIHSNQEALPLLNMQIQKWLVKPKLK